MLLLSLLSLENFCGGKDLRSIGCLWVMTLLIYFDWTVSQDRTDFSVQPVHQIKNQDSLRHWK